MKKLETLILVTALVVMTCFYARDAAAVDCISNISNNPARDDFWAQINASGHVVWHDRDGSNDYKINYWDGSTVTNIYDNPAGSESMPNINASGHVIWKGWDGTDWDVYYWDGTNVNNISNRSGGESDPRINANGHVVWGGNYGTDYDIYYWDGLTVTNISNNPDGNEWGPQINTNGHVVWWSNRIDGTDSEIYYWDGSTVTNISNNPAVSDGYCQINESGHVVWSGFVGGTDHEIYYWDGLTVTNISNNPAGYDGTPQINASGHVVWSGDEGNSADREVYYWDGSMVSNISNNPAGFDGDARINASGQVVWSGDDSNGTGREIYYWDGLTVTNISNNPDGDDNRPDMNVFGEVVWDGSDVTNNEIYLAELDTCVSSTTTTTTLFPPTTTTTLPPSVNDFSGDGNAKALWSVDNGALTIDSIGTNTLTDNNTVGTDTFDYQEGDASADFVASNSEFLSITDANLASGFPLKSGESNGDFSLTFWFKLESLNSFAALFSKWDAGAGARSFLLSDNNGTLEFYIGTNSGTDFELLDNSLSTSTGRWYHVGATFNNTTKAWRLRVWDDTVGSVVLNASGTATNNISITPAPFAIGASHNSGLPEWFIDSRMDEIVVFSDILTTVEIDQIRQGTYAEVTPPTTTTTTLFPPTTTTTTLPPICGNGTIETGEACDDGAANGTTTCGCLSDCTYAPAATSCADGLYCNGDETCDGAGTCQAGTPVTCDDGVGCTEDFCDEAGDACVNIADNTNCPDDGSFCNGTEFCDEANDCSSTGDPCSGGDICNETTDSCEQPGVSCADIADRGTCNDDPNCEWVGSPKNGSCQDIPAAEICDSGIDEDGDGLIDCEDPDCAGVGSCPALSCSEIPDKDSCISDQNCEWIGSPKNGTCQDAVSCVPDETPEATCTDGVDNDCDGMIDCADTADCGGDPACQGGSCDTFTDKTSCQNNGCTWSNKDKVCM